MIDALIVWCAWCLVTGARAAAYGSLMKKIGSVSANPAEQVIAVLTLPLRMPARVPARMQLPFGAAFITNEQRFDQRRCGV